MVQPSTNVPDLPTDVDNHVGGLPTTEFPARPASRSARGPQVGVRTRVMRQAVVLEVAGRLHDVVEDLDRAIELALADGPVAWSVTLLPCWKAPSRVRLRCSRGRAGMSATGPAYPWPWRARTRRFARRWPLTAWAGS
jgi:hypothetical protein